LSLSDFVLITDKPGLVLTNLPNTGIEVKIATNRYRIIKAKYLRLPMNARIVIDISPAFVGLE
jgi:hypothetical protein